MGGMTALEWPLCTPLGYVRCVIPIATSIAQTAWGISWSDVQRRCIVADPLFQGGSYEPDQQPTSGLATARMAAMLTYRSAESFERRFGRKQSTSAMACNGSSSRSVKSSPPPPGAADGGCAATRQFAVQDYLDYQGTKFLRRFDANCYLHLTRKMDTHDVRRGRGSGPLGLEDNDGPMPDGTAVSVLSRVPSHALVVGIESDVLFLHAHVQELAACLPDATLAILNSSDGHDGFLLEFEQLNHLILDRLKWRFPDLYEGFTEKVADVDVSHFANGVSVGEMD